MQQGNTVSLSLSENHRRGSQSNSCPRDPGRTAVPAGRGSWISRAVGPDWVNDPHLGPEDNSPNREAEHRRPAFPGRSLRTREGEPENEERAGTQRLRNRKSLPKRILGPNRSGLRPENNWRLAGPAEQVVPAVSILQRRTFSCCVCAFGQSTLKWQSQPFANLKQREVNPKCDFAFSIVICWR